MAESTPQHDVRLAAQRFRHRLSHDDALHRIRAYEDTAAALGGGEACSLPIDPEHARAGPLSAFVLYQPYGMTTTRDNRSVAPPIRQIVPSYADDSR